MSEIQSITGRGIPLTGNDIDTDRIIPARFLKCVTFDGLGEQVFADDRVQMQGQHPFDLPQYQGARVLVVNGNFGCGSSREHAPQAIARWGIQTVVGESFAEIFFGNCIALGIPCVMAEPSSIQTVQQMLLQDPTVVIEVNLQSMQLTCGEFTTAITMGEGSRQMFLSGTWDACGQLVSQSDNIQAIAAKLPYTQWGTAS